MICENDRFGFDASARDHRGFGLRRLADLLPEIMARYELRPGTQPQRELVLSPPGNPELSATVV